MSGSPTALVVHESQAEQIVVLAVDDDNIFSSTLALFDEAMLSAPLRRLCSSTASEWWFASGRFYAMATTTTTTASTAGDAGELSVRSEPTVAGWRHRRRFFVVSFACTAALEGGVLRA